MFSATEKKVAKYFFIIIFVTIAVISCIVIATRDNNKGFVKEDYYTKTYEVQQGDTLWEIGSCYKKSDDNVRDWIKAVKEINAKSTSSIEAGDYITILVPKTIND